MRLRKKVVYARSADRISNRIWVARATLSFMVLTSGPTAPASALQLTAPDPKPSVSSPPEQSQTIGDTSEIGSDERIARRIEDIFTAVPALKNVSASVSNGVVVLSGEVPTVRDVARAEQIASRIQGVVTVENQVERDLSVEESFQSLGGFSQKFEKIWKMLPLIGVAILIALFIAAIGYGIASLTWIWRRIAPNNFLTDLIATSVRFVFVTAGIVIALQVVGAAALLGAVLGGAGIIGIALGFAMRDTIENYVSSIMLSLRQPFRANDWVVIEQFEGRVVRLTSRATILMTLDGNHLRIPNSTVFKGVILNYTRNPQRRFDFTLGIDATADPSTARELGVDALVKLDFVLEDPAPTARLVDVGDSNILIKFLGWIDQDKTDWYKARSKAIPAVKAALESSGFALPEPIYRVRFDENAPLPLKSIAKKPSPASPELPAGSEMIEQAAPERTAPDDDITGMVAKERAESSDANEDLLDPQQPVE